MSGAWSAACAPQATRRPTDPTSCTDGAHPPRARTKSAQIVGNLGRDHRSLVRARLATSSMVMAVSSRRLKMRVGIDRHDDGSQTRR